MNVGQLVRSLVGELKPADVKTLELKVGQIVRGVVLQLLSEDDALVNIGGVPTRARLELPLRQGDSTLLQVQPESTPGQVVLKPLNSSGVQIAEESLSELLDAFGLKDTSASRKDVQLLQRESVPLTKESVQDLMNAFRQKPANIPETEWKMASILAWKRGLPLTEESVASLRAAVFGPSLDRAMRSMAALADAALGQGELSDTTKALIGKLRGAIAELERTAQAPGMQPADSVPEGIVRASASTKGGPSVAASPSTSAFEEGPNAPSVGTDTRQSPQWSANSGRAPLGISSVQDTPNEAGNATPNGLSTPTGTSEAALTLRDSGQRGSESTRPETAHTSGNEGTVPTTDSGLGNDTHAVKATVDAPKAKGKAAGLEQAANSGQWISRVLKLLGVDHEQVVGKLAEPSGTLQGKPADSRTGTASDSDGQGALATAGTDDAVGSPTANTKPTETIKSLLLQLDERHDAPKELKEAAQDTIHQLTGQQLLLTPDRSAMFAHATLMLPLYDPAGSQTAAIHLQSRRGRKGELDANNCRLLFDLQMKTLGSTIVDVQVVERMVSLQVLNDHPLLAGLIGQGQQEIAAGLEAAGFRLIALKAQPFPQQVKPEQQPADASGTAVTDAKLRSLYTSKPYKGMDIRI